METMNVIKDEEIKGGTELVSELNESNELVRESNDTDKKLESFADIFTKRGNVMQVVKDGEQLRNAFVKQLSHVTQIAVESEVTEDISDKLYSDYKKLGKKPHDLTNAELDTLFEGITFVDGVESKIGKTFSFHEFLKEYLVLFTASQESIEMTNAAMAQIDEANKDYIQEVDKLISGLDTFERMNELLAESEAEEDPVKKAALIHEWELMYSASDLDFILAKLNNKPRKVLIKEMKSYKDIEKKAFNILKNDPKSQFMDIRALEAALTKVYGEQLTEQIRIVLFLLYKKINKRNRVEDDRLVVFINLFSLNTYKMIKYTEQEKISSVFYNKLKEALELI